MVNGKVTNSSGAGIANAQVIVFNGNTNTPFTTLVTSADGSYSTELNPGNYFIKVYSQGYKNIPATGLSSVPFAIIVGTTLTNNYQMTASTVVNPGLIKGMVSTTAANKSGILVVANDGKVGYSSVTDGNGSYTIFNIPTGSYTVNGWVAGYSSSQVSATVVGSVETSNVNLMMTSGTMGSVTGAITFAATTNIETDVSLVNPYTLETIAGLSTTTSGGNYTITNVPTGTYIGRASFANDGKVIDPDYIVKNGEPTVIVSGGAATLNFTATGAVTLLMPTNEAATTIPVKVNSTTPTFSWTAYSSTDDYVIEVMNSNGQVIWGGFTGSGTSITKNIVILKSATSIVYNSDGMAKAPLEVGKVYRWRIYASKSCNGCTPAWTLISKSEDQMGLIMP